MIPPVVSEAPFPRQVFHKGQHGLTAFNPLIHRKAASTTSTTNPATVRAPRIPRPRPNPSAVPRGPAATAKKKGQ